MAELLNSRWERFAQVYAVTDNITKSALEAGFPVSGAATQGSRLLKRVEIKDRINEIRAPRNNHNIAEIDEILAFFSKTMRDEEGTSSQNRIKAAELLGKAKRMFVEQVEVTGELVVFSGDDAIPD